jgi:hypothetical protein
MTQPLCFKNLNRIINQTLIKIWICSLVFFYHFSGLHIQNFIKMLIFINIFDSFSQINVLFQDELILWVSIFVPWEYPSHPLTIFTDSRLSWFKINQSFIKEIFLSISFDDFRNFLLHSQVSFSNCHILYPTSCIFLIYSNHEKIILTQNDLWINYLTNYRISILIICFLLSVLWEIFIFLINFLETFPFAFILFFIHFI